MVDNIRLPTGYFLGFTAATGELADNHDIISVRVFDVDQEVGGDGEQVREGWVGVARGGGSTCSSCCCVPSGLGHCES